MRLGFTLGRSAAPLVLQLSSAEYYSAMLVVSRKVGQALRIGKNISVTIVQVAPGSVRLCIEATAGATIVHEKIGDTEIVRVAVNDGSSVDQAWQDGLSESVVSPSYH
jgi:carbon storage regulator CsrA